MDGNISVLECIYKSILDKDAERTETLLKITKVNPNEILPDKGINILHLAAGINPEEYAKQISEIIIAHGGNPNERSDDGMTPLHVAAVWGRINVVKMLIEHGGDMLSLDDDGKTPLDYADEQHHLSVAKYLKEAENYNHCGADSPNKYTFKLDKIFVHNGLVEGEYVPEEIHTEITKIEAFKKSEIISEWFAKSPKLGRNSNYEDEINNVTPVNKNKAFSLIDIEIEMDSNISKLVTTNDVEITKGNNRSSRKLDDSKQSSLYRSCLASFNETRKSLAETEYCPQLDYLSNQEMVLEDNSLTISDHSMSGIVPIEFTKNSYNNLFSVFLKQSTIEDSLKKCDDIKSPVDLLENKCRIEDSINKCDDIKSPVDLVENKCTEYVTPLSENNYSKADNIFETCDIINEIEYIEHSTILTSHRSDKSYYCQADCSSSSASQISDRFNKALVLNDNISSIPHNISDGNTKYTNRLGNTLDIISVNSSRVSQKDESLNVPKINMSNASSRLSAHNIIINETLASITEEYKYEDGEAGVALIEKRILVTPVPLSTESCDGSLAMSKESAASSLPMAIDYDTDNLRKELISLGVTAGPITKSTKKVYMKRLRKLRKNPIIVISKKDVSKTYSIELEKTFRDPNWNVDLKSYITLERQISHQFEESDPGKRWREGVTKSSFTYLLLDPRITENLPCRAEIVPRPEIWRNFIDSIFYIGKGKRSRPYSHLYQAVTSFNNGQMKSSDKKIQNILDIWKEKSGVVCLHIFQNVIPVEAYTREAAMIEVIGLKNLKNIKPGNYYGVVSTWPLKQKKLLGVYLLYKAMLIFLSEGERQLRPADIG